MTVVARDGDRGAGSGAEFRRRKRGRNLAMLLAIFAACALFYAITIVRMV